jgi:hypothetical protein
VYRPGCPLAEGVEEKPVTCDPLNDVATHSVCFNQMVEHQIYTGAGKKFRRRELEIVQDNPKPKFLLNEKGDLFTHTVT